MDNPGLLHIQVDKQALKTTMICTAIIWIKCFYANLQMGRARVRAGTRPPEDAPLFPRSGN